MGVAAWLAVAAILAAIPTVTAFSVPGVRYSLLALVAPAWVGITVAWAVWIARERPGRAGALLPAIVLILGVAVILELPLRVRFAISRPAFEEMIGHQRYMPSQQGLFVVDVQRFTGPGEVEFTVRNGDIDQVAWGFSYSLDGPPGKPIDGPLPVREQRYRHLDGNWYLWAIYSPDSTY